MSHPDLFGVAIEECECILRRILDDCMEGASLKFDFDGVLVDIDFFVTRPEQLPGVTGPPEVKTDAAG